MDDDPSMRTGIRRLLSVHGFPSELFESADALLCHQDFGEALCLVLDINLNGESGIDLCRSLLDKGERVPVIYITGNDSEANRAAARASGCIAYLTKPFAGLSLIESIEKARSTTA